MHSNASKDVTVRLNIQFLFDYNSVCCFCFLLFFLFNADSENRYSLWTIIIILHGRFIVVDNEIDINTFNLVDILCVAVSLLCSSLSFRFISFDLIVIRIKSVMWYTAYNGHLYFFSSISDYKRCSLVLFCGNNQVE